MLKIINILTLFLSFLPINNHIDSFSYTIYKPHEYRVQFPIFINPYKKEAFNLLNILDEDDEVIISYPNRLFINNEIIKINTKNNYLSNDRPSFVFDFNSNIKNDFIIPITLSYKHKKKGLTLNPYSHSVLVLEKISSILNKEERMIIDMPTNICIGQTNITIELLKKVLYKDEDLIMRLHFDRMDEESLDIEIPYSYKIENCFERKTIYAYKKITEWSNEIYYEKPESYYKEIKVYGYKEILTYSKDNYVLSKPNDPYYEEAIQYGKMSKQYYAIYKIECEDSCSLSCNKNNTYYDEKGNKYCLLYVNGYDNKQNEGVLYKEAAFRYVVLDDDWSFDKEDNYEYPYIQTKRTVYLLPEKISEIKGQRKTPYQPSNTIIPVTINAYLIPKNFSNMSSWSDEYPVGEDIIIYEKELVRYKNEDGTFGDWQ